MTNRKPLPIGIDKFSKLRSEGYYYTDKSMMLADFLSDGAEVTLITRPRCFGKTLNMDMVHEFLDIDRDSRNLFKGLAIMKTPYRNEMNTRPVLSFSFRNCKGGSAYLIGLIKKELYREFCRFDNAAASLAGMDRREYQAIIESLLSGDSDTLPKAVTTSFVHSFRRCSLPPSKGISILTRLC